ncbi:MAG: hypothetical protein E7401_05830 [Ruminococcaceae bacterium]|nr:hypothetical protein [Oscillospiraceae bacterium]
MKKHFFKSLIALCLSFVICAMPAFAANTISIADGGISIDFYEDASGKVNEDYVKVTVTYTATRDETVEKMSRITFALSAIDPEEKLAGNEAKVVYLDEQVTPTDDSKYTFVIKKSRIQSALGKEKIEDIEGLSLYFKMGGVGVEKAAVKEVVYYSPKNALYGDLYTDGFVDSSDALAMLRADAQLLTLTAEQSELGDILGDGTVDSADALAVLRLDAQLITYEQIMAVREQNLSN